MQRPWSVGVGWLLAMVVLLVAIIGLLVPLSIAHLDLWLIGGLALAVILG